MRALVLSGGGANGAFELGALSHILGVRAVKYDIIVGVSVGALNGAFLSQYPAGEEKEASRGLETMWGLVQQDRDIYKKWCWGLLPAPTLFFLKMRPSVYCSAPLRALVRGQLSVDRMRTSGKTFSCGAVGWGGASEYRTWDQRSDDIVDAVLASSAYPVFFEPISIGGVEYTDGGLRETTPIKAAIELGAQHIDVIQCSPKKMLSVAGKLRGLDQVKRAIGVALHEVDADDFTMAEMVNAMVACGCPTDPRWRSIKLNRVLPKQDLGDSLDFSATKAKSLYALGREAAESMPDAWSE